MADIPTPFPRRWWESTHSSWFALIMGIAVALTGITVLAGWLLDVEVLQRIRPQYTAMNPATAVGFLCAGMALAILSMPKFTRSVRWIAGAFSGMVVLIGILRINGYALGWDGGVDLWLFASKVGDNRMAPNTATSFMFSGLALLCMAAMPRLHFPRSLLICAAAVLPTLALIGYCQGVASFYQIGIFIGMALHTTLAFVVLAIGMLGWGLRGKATEAARESTNGHGSPDPHFNLERKVGTVFATALFLLTIVGIVSYRSTNQLIEAARIDNHTREVLTDINTLMTFVAYSETGQRGFLITGQEVFLEPYEAAVKGIMPAVADLRALIADNPVQQQRLETLEQLIREKLELSEHLIQLRRDKGFEAAQQIVATGRGKRMLDQIRAEMEGMIQEEQRLLAIRSQQVSQTAHATVLVIVVGCFVTFVVVVGAGWFIHRDIAARRRIERQLAEMRKSAEAASHAKSEFLANMSHEIRTPMAAILGYADLLLDHNLDPSDRLNHLNVVRRNGQHLLAIINDILDLSKIEAGQLKVERIACRPCQILSEVASILRVRAVEKRLTLQVKLEGKIPEFIQSDPMRLRQVLINLVGNAIKFTEHGWVRLTTSLIDPPDAPNPRMQFQITDTGVGLTGEQIAGLFQPFGQVDNSATRRFGGTGLGLVISRRMVREMGGDITVESDPGRGSRFTATIETGPMAGVKLLSRCTEAVLQTEKRSTGPAVALHGRVLLVEDGIDNRRLLKLYLSRAGIETVDEAENGQEGCERVIQAQAQGQPYDIVLMDIQMPIMDGYSATSKLRTAGCRVPIIALTAHAMVEDRDRCMAAGCTDYLSKPVDRNKLLQTVAKYLKPDANQDPTLHSDPGLDDDVRELVPQFVDDLPHTVGRMLASLESRELDQLQETIHQIKGTAGQYGFMQITDLAAAVESQLKAEDDADMDSINGAVRELVELIRRVEGYNADKEAEAAA